SVQRRYDVGYMQCMYAKGNQIPVSRGSVPYSSNRVSTPPPPPPMLTPPPGSAPTAPAAPATPGRPSTTTPPNTPPPPPGTPPPSSPPGSGASSTSSVDATGTVASVDASSGTITLSDGRVLRATDRSVVYQPTTAQALSPATACSSAARRPPPCERPSRAWGP